MNDEHRRPRAMVRAHFINRLAQNGAWAALLVALSDAGGTVGYRYFGYRWIDAFLNASMLLGGMGPVGDLPNDGAKVFASLFALYSGLVFLVVAGLLLAPVFHRVLHRFHFDEK
jgi:hypothetical protein